jgi:glycosyltransferase involved in cell wall biosynthesis
MGHSDQGREHGAAPSDDPPRISLVVPAYDEAESIQQLHAEATATLSDVGPHEIIFVDDGSADETAAEIAALMAQDARVRGFRLPRNEGKSAAYTVGFAAAGGEIVVTADADLQDDLSELPKLLERLDEGHDLVVGHKLGRFKNEPLKAMPSWVFNVFVWLLFGLRLHDSNCGFRAMRSPVAKNLRLYGDLYRFIPELAHVAGHRVTEVGVQHRRRRHGRSKFGPFRFWTGLMDLFAARFVTAFIAKPLQFFGTVALLAFCVGAGLEIYVLAMKAGGDTFREHIAALIVGAFFILVAVQVLAVGFVGEMIAARADRNPADMRAAPIKPAKRSDAESAVSMARSSESPAASA